MSKSITRKAYKSPTNNHWWWRWRTIRPEYQVGEVVKLDRQDYIVDKLDRYGNVVDGKATFRRGLR